MRLDTTIGMWDGAFFWEKRAGQYVPRVVFVDLKRDLWRSVPSGADDQEKGGHVERRYAWPGGSSSI
jgi:hypothetical protein